jgi:Zn-dependent protease
MGLETISQFDIIRFIAMAIALLVAIIGHEIMHGAVANHYGDTTAKNLGRLSINPIKHIDPLGTIIFPIFLYLSQSMAGVNDPLVFGWAKPVPVNMRTVISNGGLMGAFWVSMAGVIYNFIIAVIASFLISSFLPVNSLADGFMLTILYYMIVINIILMVLNLLPIPPLDGANAISYLTMRLGTIKVAEFMNKIEKYGMIILLIILLVPQLNQIVFYPANIIIALLISGGI